MISTAYDEALAWVVAELPEEFPPFAAAAVVTLSRLGEPIGADAVRGQLRAHNRDAESLRKDGTPFTPGSKWKTATATRGLR